MAKVIVTHNLDNIPDELKALVQWVVASNLKVPIHARIGTHASTTNPGTWSSYGKARDVVLSGKHKYIGFVFTKNDPYVGIDLDDVRDSETGEILPWAQEIIDLLDSYTEISQSGMGIHIIVRGKKSGELCRKGNIEIYEHSRYFALTGNVLGPRSTIEDRQGQLDTLYTETFGGDKGVRVQGSKSVSDLVFDRDAQPPSLKLEDLRRRKGFSKTYEHKREDLPSLSEYDISLANYAARNGWTDQEIADLIIAFRRRHGEEKDLKKALRFDYISDIIAKVRHSDALELLPFKVKSLIQLGTEDADYILELENGISINMGETASFLSSRRACQRLYDAGYVLHPAVVKRWDEIVIALRLLVKVKPTITDLEGARQWLMSHLGRSGIKPTLIDPESSSYDLSLVMYSEYGSARGVAVDKEGRVYIHLSSVIAHARMTLGQNLSLKSLAGYLRRMDFENLENVSIHYEGVRRQVSLWMSPAGFVPDELTTGREVEKPPQLTEGKGHSIEEENDEGLDLLGSSPIEESARKMREKGI